jgi:hypothetical protein
MNLDEKKILKMLENDKNIRLFLWNFEKKHFDL